MKIAILVAEPSYPDNTGGRIYTWNRIKQLKQEGHEIYLYGFKDNEKIDNENMKKVCNDIKFYNRNTNKFKALINIEKPFTAYSRYSNQLCKDLKIDSIKREYDLIILDMPQLAYNVSTDLEVPIIISQHNIEYRTFFEIGKNSKKIIKKSLFLFEALKLKFFEKRIYQNHKVKAFTCISNLDLKFFENTYKDKEVLLVPVGYNFNENLIRNKEENIIVFTGKMDYEPNVEAVKWFSNKIFPIILKKFPDFKFFVVGKNPTKEILELENSNICVTGTVPDVNYYIDKAKLCVIPLLSGGGVKIKLIEALSRKKIVVSTSKGIEGTNFKDKIHLLVSDTGEEFAEKCIKVIENSDAFENLILNSENLIKEKYSWKSIGANYSYFLKQIVEVNK